MKKSISFTFNTNKVEEREELHIIEGAFLLSQCKDDFQQKFRSYRKHGDHSNKDAYAVIEEIWEMYFDSMKAYHAREET